PLGLQECEPFLTREPPVFAAPSAVPKLPAEVAATSPRRPPGALPPVDEHTVREPTATAPAAVATATAAAMHLPRQGEGEHTTELPFLLFFVAAPFAEIRPELVDSLAQL